MVRNQFDAGFHPGQSGLGRSRVDGGPDLPRCGDCVCPPRRDRELCLDPPAFDQSAGIMNAASQAGKLAPKMGRMS